MTKVLIADRSDVFCKALNAQLAKRFETCVCDNGMQVLELCRTFEPDILILDLELSQKDGISILRALSSSGRSVAVLATTACFYSDYVMQTLVQLGVHYVLPKPCTVAAVVARIQEIVAGREKKLWNLEEEVNSLLLTMGLRTNLRGYSCLCEAMLATAADREQQITKVIYPQVAQICGGTPKRVERAIRLVILDAWKNREESVWRLFFTPGRDGELPCPSNGDFIARMLMCLDDRKTA